MGNSTCPRDEQPTTQGSWLSCHDCRRQRRARLVLKWLIAVVLVSFALLFVPAITREVRLVTFFVSIAMLLLFYRYCPPRLLERGQTKTLIDGDGVRRILGDQTVEKIRWYDMIGVSIVTTDEGPFVEDMYFLLRAADGSACVVPNDEARDAKLLHRLHRLPRFDELNVITASGSSENAEFVCWEGVIGEGMVASREPKLSALTQQATGRS